MARLLWLLCLSLGCTKPAPVADSGALADAAPAPSALPGRRADEPCTAPPKALFCAEDKKSLLGCVEGKYAVRQSCPGPNGCKEAEAGAVVCDTLGPFEPLDKCVTVDRICSANGKSLLRCSRGHLLVEQLCEGEHRCANGVCDPGYAVAGELCAHHGWRACSRDKAKLLECAPSGKPGVASTWVATRTCKGACVAKDAKLECK